MLKKTWLLMLAAVLVIVAAAVPALSEGSTNTVPALSAAFAAADKTLTVNGSASIILKADYASLNLGVNTKGATVSDAQTANSQIMDKVIAAIREQGVAEEDIATSSFNVYANYDYQYSKLSNEETLSSYQVENMLSVTVRDVTKVSAVLDAAMNAGANQSYGISFSSSKQSEAYDEALKAAVQDGVRKATLLSGSMDKKLGDLITMEEKEYSYNLYSSSAMFRAAEADATPILSGQITVNATVTMTYAFE